MGGRVCFVSVGPGKSRRDGDRGRPLSIAVVGGVFGGVGAAVMLQRSGYDDVTVFEREKRIGGVWHQRHLSGGGLRRPFPPL